MYKFMESEVAVAEPSGNGTAPETKTLISMHNIWKTYQMGVEELHALRDVSFQVEKGEYLAIIGPSGSGKSGFARPMSLVEASADCWSRSTRRVTRRRRRTRRRPRPPRLVRC